MAQSLSALMEQDTIDHDITADKNNQDLLSELHVLDMGKIKRKPKKNNNNSRLIEDCNMD